MNCARLIRCCTVRTSSWLGGLIMRDRKVGRDHVARQSPTRGHGGFCSWSAIMVVVLLIDALCRCLGWRGGRKRMWVGTLIVLSW
jgi:hypothetical protein